MNRHERHLLSRLTKDGTKINRPLLADMLKLSRARVRENDWRTDALAERANLAAMIHEKAVNGWVGLYEWGMDCDCASSDSIRLYPAHAVRRIEREIDRLYECAEGPVRWHLCEPEKAAGFKSTRRDHALEAFEDGHPHYVTY